MRWDFLIFLSISLANPLFANDFVQAPFEVAAASPNLGLANRNALNFDPSDATFGTDWAALDSSLVNDRVIVAGGAQQHNLPQRKKYDNLSPTWIRKVPLGRGAPKPSNPNIPEGAWGRYPGYPNQNTELDDMYELDPNTRERLRFKRQLKLHCDEGLALLCCRPLFILCNSFHEGWPECIPGQQKCCETVDIFFNGVNCRDATEPNEGTQSNDNQPNQNEYHNEGPDFVLPFDLNWPKIDELIPGV